jgi:hypothetical protein
MSTKYRSFACDEQGRKYVDLFEVDTDEGTARVVPVLFEFDPDVPGEEPSQHGIFRWLWAVYDVTPQDDPAARPVRMLWRKRGDRLGSYWVGMTEYEYPAAPWTEPIADALRGCPLIEQVTP